MQVSFAISSLGHKLKNSVCVAQTWRRAHMFLFSRRKVREHLSELSILEDILATPTIINC